MEVDYAARTRRRDDLLAGFARFSEKHSVIADAETSQRATDFAKQIKDFTGSVETERVARKRNYDDAAKTVQAFFKSIMEPLEAKETIIKTMLTTWQRAEAKRIRDEAAAEAARLQDEADRLARAAEKAKSPELAEQAAQTYDRMEKADAIAEAPASRVGGVRGSFGGVSSLRTTWKFDLLDIKAVAAAVVAGRLPPEVLMIDSSVLNGMIKRKDNPLRVAADAEPLYGIRVYADEQASVR